MGLHRHAFWLYGVVVGLAIQQALLSLLPKLIDPNDTRIGSWSEALRLFVFLLLIIRFFLGSAAYFDEVYCGTQSDKYDKKSYGLDYLLGFVHFVVFFGWALTIDLQQSPSYLFPSMLAFILLYDLVWLWVSRNNDTANRIKLWAFVNALTFLLGASFYVIGPLRIA